MEPNDADYPDYDEATINASHEAVARSWRSLKAVPTDNTAYLLMLTGPSAPRMFPVGKETMVGRNGNCAIEIDDESVSREHARITVSESGEFLLEDLGSRNGTRVNGETVKAHKLGSGDRLQFGSSTIFLVTYHTRLEDQLLEVRKLESEGRLAAGLALNYRAILKPLLEQADRLHTEAGQGPIDPERLRPALNEIIRSAQRAQDLAQELLSFSRCGEYIESDVDLSDLLREVARIIPHPIDRSIKIETRVDSGLKVVGDTNHLRTAMTQLTDNALDAMPQGGTLTIMGVRTTLSAAQMQMFPLLGTENAVRITVKDTGVGMHAEVVRRVFEPFFSTKPTRSGTGLGLAIVERIVKSHRGHIEIQSHLGEGTAIHLYLPAA